jgi:hypothetical protein
MKRIFLAFVCLSIASFAWAQEEGAEESWGMKFEQLDPLLPTPNSYRTGSGAPGENYWQQKANYTINVTLDDENQRVTGSQTITYFNQSPHTLEYLWLQLDQNIRGKDSNSPKVRTSIIRDSVPAKFIQQGLNLNDFEGGHNITKVTDANGNPLPYIINKTMMRIDLPQHLKPGQNVVFNISWWYNINDRMELGGRSGYEYFPEDDNYLYTIAQFFPRMVVYDDKEGWQNKQFLGSGEFALTFGDYRVQITVPEDHIVAATGWLQNPEDVLTREQIRRFEQAQKSFDKPVIIVTEKEARANERTKEKGTKTWIYKAENVRDFAFASSRKFIWDAQAVKIGNKTPLAMSYYPKEGNPLWEEESTKAVKNTLETYSKYTIDYPYPVAISVHAASIGMEYPMICFNFGRPNPDGTYSDRTKYGMIGVIIHEVGHNFFPMIINSDERQWTWMDEGLNSFVQYRTESEQYVNFPSRRGPAENIIPYMSGDKRYIRPIMTNSEQILQFGHNAYGKPATALSILRETVMGHGLFDIAFKEYATRWAFKHPAPADFFRTMEDASAIDLDWFWRGWFYSTDHVDIAVDEVKWFKLREETAELEGRYNRGQRGDLSENGDGEPASDFSKGPAEFSIIDTDDRYYGEYMNRINDQEVREKLIGKNLYEVHFSNEGGLVMPIIIEFNFTDGTSQMEHIPAEIWRYNEKEVSKVFYFDKEVESVVLDPERETADVDVQDNIFPRVEQPSKFDEFQQRRD